MNSLFERPRLLGLLCAAVAVGLGLAYMAAADAPSRYLAVNLAALLLGATAWFALRPPVATGLVRSGWPVLVMALPLLATALWGSPVAGASRWVNLGPIAVQTSLVFVPPLVVLFARRIDAIATFGVGLAALALAIQPDRAMAGALAVGIGAIVLSAPSRLAIAALAMAAAAFVAAILQADALPAVPFVDRILYTAFEVHPATGLAVVAGCLILLLPVVSSTLEASDRRAAILAFGACWAAVVLAAALGHYPTPLVGYGGSAVLGYLLSAALLPGRTGNDPNPGPRLSGA